MQGTILEIMYIFGGIIAVTTGIYALKDSNNTARLGTALFWILFGLIFIIGKYIPSYLIGIFILTWEAVKLLPSQINHIQVVTAQIPTVFRDSIDCLLGFIEQEKPDIVICIGQAGGRFELSIERIGINIDDARIPDNKQNQPIDLPIKKMMQQVRAAGIPCAISNTAGTFVCNHILYALLYHINKSHVAKAGGFIHVPYIPEQVITKPSQPYMSIPMIRDGLTEIIKALDLEGKDSKIIGGAEH